MFCFQCSVKLVNRKTAGIFPLFLCSRWGGVCRYLRRAIYCHDDRKHHWRPRQKGVSYGPNISSPFDIGIPLISNNQFKFRYNETLVFALKEEFNKGDCLAKTASDVLVKRFFGCT